MKKSLFTLVLVCSTACRTSEASSSSTTQPQAVTVADAASFAVPKENQLLAENKAGEASKAPAARVREKEGKAVKSEDKSLLKWRMGRWSLVKEGNEAVEKMDQAGTVACDITSALVQKHLGADKVKALEAAIAEVYKIKDQRQSSPIFRGLDKSRELVAYHNGQEFMIEKMYQARDSINPTPATVVSRDIAKASDAETALETIMEVAINPLVCPRVPS